MSSNSNDELLTEYYSIASDVSTKFCFEISNGYSFSKLFEYLKNGENAVIKLTKNSMTYNELISKKIEGSNKKAIFNVNNSCEFQIENFKNYQFESPNEEYNLFINIKGFKDKIKKIPKNDGIKIYKQKDDELIYIQVISSGEPSSGISFIRPLNMQNCETYTHPVSNITEETPNCLINLKNFKADCSKISPTEYKTVKMIGYNSKMEIRAMSPDNSDGHIFVYENKGIKQKIKGLNIDVSKLSNYEDITIDLDFDENPIQINMPTNLLKNLTKLTQLSEQPLRVFFEDENYIKIIALVKDYATLRIYIKDDN